MTKAARLLLSFSKAENDTKGGVEPPQSKALRAVIFTRAGGRTAGLHPPFKPQLDKPGCQPPRCHGPKSAIAKYRKLPVGNGEERSDILFLSLADLC
jgi:hypothetical protein